MTDDPAGLAGTEGAAVEPSAGPSTEIVLAERRQLALAPGRWSRLATAVRGRLDELRRHPAAVASVSAATTIGGALLINGLRQASRAAVATAAAGRSDPAGSAGPTGSTVVGYVLHEVHVFYHAVQPADRRDLEVYTGRW